MKIQDGGNPIILGLSCFYHDASAAILCGDEIIAAAQEERFTRKKFDNRFPVHALNFCLEEAGIKADSINCIAFYEEPYLKLNRLFETQTSFSPLRIGRNTKRIEKWVNEKLFVEEHIMRVLPEFKGEVCFFSHHASHAASAFYPSPFSSAAILTVDGVGEWSCASIGRGDGNKMQVLMEQRFPHSVGLLYSAFTQYIGFKVDSGEYKLMGLAPYGDPVYIETIKKHLVKINDDGSIELNTKYFDFMTGNRMTNERFHGLFKGRPRKPSEPITQKEMDIACSVQRVTEEILLKMAAHAVKVTDIRTLCLAGGVTLNCVANGKIMRSGLIDKLWVQPAAGDAGGALGAAFLCAYERYGLERKVNGIEDKQKSSLLGPRFGDDEIKKLLDSYGFMYRKVDLPLWSEQIASMLSEGKVVGLFHGRMEYGPRALGDRSILGDPRDKDMQRRMNLKIKFRESFRPFAPIVLEERAKEWFSLDTDSPYMLLTTDVKPSKRKNLSKEEETLWGIDKLNTPRSDIPAVTHVDYSARVQTVDRDSNERVYDLLRAFERLTGCPVLINTSFNIRGEPIVCTPFDALRCFMNTNIDVLVIEDYIIKKEDQGCLLKDASFQRSFEPD